MDRGAGSIADIRGQTGEIYKDPFWTGWGSVTLKEDTRAEMLEWSFALHLFSRNKILVGC